MLKKRKSQLYGANKLPKDVLERLKNHTVAGEVNKKPTVQEQITNIELALVEIYEEVLE